MHTTLPAISPSPPSTPSYPPVASPPPPPASHSPQGFLRGVLSRPRLVSNRLGLSLALTLAAAVIDPRHQTGGGDDMRAVADSQGQVRLTTRSASRRHRRVGVGVVCRPPPTTRLRLSLCLRRRRRRRRRRRFGGAQNGCIDRAVGNAPLPPSRESPRPPPRERSSTLSSRLHHEQRPPPPSFWPEPGRAVSYEPNCDGSG